MRDEIILSGPGYVVFHCILEGHKFINNVSYCHVLPSQNKVSLSLPLSGRGIEDHKNHFMTEKKATNNDHLYERNNNLCISGFPVTYNQCILVLDSIPSPLPLVLGPVIITPYNELWLCARVSHIQKSHNFSHYSLE